MTRVMGLDLSIDRTGVALPSGQLATYHPPGEGDGRLVYIEAAIAYYIAAGAPDVVAVEKIPESLRGGVITVVRLGLVHGVARFVMARLGVPFAYVPVPTLKKYATGNGHAKKPDMVNACRDVGIDPKDDNEADAAWLRLAGIHRYDRTPPSPAHALSVELISGPQSRVKWPDLSTTARRRRSGTP